MSDREKWATRRGFVLATIGSAVGLGNVWRFPFRAGQEGGGAFVLMYVLFVVVVGFPTMLGSFTMGRRTQLNPIDAFEELGGGCWKYAGAFVVFTSAFIVTYYSVVSGWLLRYVLGSVTNSYAADPQAYFQAASSGPDAILFHGVYMALALIVVAAGLREGVETTVRYLVPVIVLLLGGLAAYAATLDGAAQGYEYYLSPDFGYLVANAGSVVPTAAGQAFFSLAIGNGVAITFASYLGEERNLAESGLWIAGADTVIAIVTGLIVFPVLFTIGLEPGAGGPGELFVGVAGTFGQLPLGWLLGVAFFAAVFFAALVSGIATLEILVSYATDTYDVGRKRAAAAFAAIIFAAGIPTALDTELLWTYDTVVGNVLLPISVLLVALFVGWIYDDATDELRQGMGDIGPLDAAWIRLLRVPIPLLLLAVLLRGVASMIGG